MRSINQIMHSYHDRSSWSWLAHSSKLAKLFLLTLALPAAPSAVFAIDDLFPNQQFVRYEKDSVSLAFSNLRAAEAAYLMQSSTGIAITLPTSAQTRLINLTLERANVHQTVRALLAALDLNNSFLVYDRDGRLIGVIALEKVVRPHAEAEISPGEKRRTTYRELTAKEFESILRDLGRWTELTAQEQKLIHGRLKTIPPSKLRDQIIKEYVRQVLDVAEHASTGSEEHLRHTSNTQPSPE
jgi:hypothetical protein